MYLFCGFCLLRFYCPLYYNNYYVFNYYFETQIDPPNEIDEELAPDLFDLVQPNIFEELNPEGIPGVIGIPGEQAFPQITPAPTRGF